jgi:formylglycine-generating enzyme required for sulfatase activity
MEFCKRLSQRFDRHYTLPSEAQWEYACRASTQTPFAFGDILPLELANYNGEFTHGGGLTGREREKTTDVGIFPANNWGLHDMHGNVWEWCSDWHGDYPSRDVTDPTGPKIGKERVHRGGCFLVEAAKCRSAKRNWDSPSQAFFYVGFRVVMELR